MVQVRDHDGLALMVNGFKIYFGDTANKLIGEFDMKEG